MYEVAERILIQTLEAPAQIDVLPALPAEIRYVFKYLPEAKERLRHLLSEGLEIEVRTVTECSPRLLTAVRNIAVHTQHKLILSWLRPLLRDNIDPVFNEHDRSKAKEIGFNPEEEIQIIQAAPSELKKISFSAHSSAQVVQQHKDFIDSLNQTLQPLAIEYAINRIEFDNAHERTEVAQTVIKALLIIGPITHILEIYTHGIGKVFAASCDDVLSEYAELQALRGSGFTWKQLLSRFRILIPIMFIAMFGAYAVDDLLAAGYYGLGGALFGLSAVALSLTTAVQSVGMYKTCVDDLCHEQKLSLPDGMARWQLALQQDFANPARVGLVLGAIVSPFISMAVFVAIPQLAHNGWALAMLGTIESMIAGITVFLAAPLNRLRYDRIVQKRLDYL